MPDLLLELFSEEIPARMQARAAEDLARLVTDGLKGAGLGFGKVEKFVSPRRLGLAIADVPAARPDLREEKRGPRVGAPAQALQGFLKSVGLAAIEQCEQRDVKGARYYFAVVEQKGGDTAAALADIVAAAIRGLAWPKSMRWAATKFAYVRPLHNILVLFDGKVVPGRFDCGGGTALDFTDKTFGHRFMAPGAVTIASAKDYREALRNAFVVADPAERRERIRQEAKALAAQHDLTLKDDEALLDEVTGLVEWPVALLGRIDADSMKLPPEVLVTSMRSHQKYFALETPEGAMAPHFLVVANRVTTDGGAAVIAGNERVLRARLADARFFWDTDRKVRLDERVAPLDAITWHAKLGSIGEKVRRIEALALDIARHIPGADDYKVGRAAQLCKADLTSGMVGEFPELQGVMGRYYALHDGEDAAVADAVAEHWGPAGPSDKCPTAPVSVAVALADKIHSLINFFWIGEKPTGSRDPFALRRAALGIIRLITENKLRIGLVGVANLALDFAIEDALVEEVAEKQKALASVETLGVDVSGVAASASAETAEIAWGGKFVRSPVYEFFAFLADRLKVALREKGVRHDLIDAVFALGGEDDLVRLLARVEALRGFIESEDGRNLLVAYRRAANIVKIEAKKDKIEAYGAPDSAAYAQDEEKTLAAALDKVAAESGALVGKEDFAGAMRLLAGLRAPVDAFFDKVTVNAPEPERRRNRLAVLQRLAATMDKIADFSKIEG
ncbi:MAG: glycine--tRNA ligase subunit beta [Rhodospirillaceae bacterium]|nr:glycine--tRNA ligase subunit beta [Rhodospirillaceae bacterium]